MNISQKLFALALATLASSTQASTPASVAKEFYQWALSPDTEIIPNHVQPLLGDELLRALREQRAYEEVCRANAEADMKPHMLDQSPYFFYPDRPEAITSTTAVTRNSTAWVAVGFALSDQRWTDTVLLQRRGNRWVILNIYWHEGSLIERLRQFARTSCAAEVTADHHSPVPLRMHGSKPLVSGVRG